MRTTRVQIFQQIFSRLDSEIQRFQCVGFAWSPVCTGEQDIFWEHPHFANFLGVPCCLRMVLQFPCVWGSRAASTTFLPLRLLIDILELLSPILCMLLSQGKADSPIFLKKAAQGFLKPASSECSSAAPTGLSPEALNHVGNARTSAMYTELEELSGTWITTTMSNKPQVIPSCPSCHWHCALFHMRKPPAEHHIRVFLLNIYLWGLTASKGATFSPLTQHGAPHPVRGAPKDEG